MTPSTVARPPVAAIVVAAGLSRRMREFKPTMPWGDTTVIEHVVATLKVASLREILVVTGHQGDRIVTILADKGVRCVENPHYRTGEMLSSIQVGLAAVKDDYSAALLCLGDQPQMEATTIRTLLTEGERSRWQRVVIPSHRQRAGHPILLPNILWGQIMSATESLRSLLRSHADMITYQEVGTASILADLDTPDDYRQAKP